MCRYFIHSVLTAANGGSIAENLPYTDEDLAGLLDFNWLELFYDSRLIDQKETQIFTLQVSNGNKFNVRTEN